MKEKTIMRIGRIGKAMLIILLCGMVGSVGWFIGMLQENISLTSVDHAVYAMEATGLPAEYAPPFCLRGFTGFRDYFSLTEFSIEYQNERQAVLEAIAAAENWHVMPVTASEYTEFAQCVLWGYANSDKYAENIVFDAWYYAQTTEPNPPYGRVPEGPMEQIGVHIGRGFKYALFDADTGLFIYIKQFG